MPNNNKRYSYTNFTNQPYIYYHGVPYSVQPYNSSQNCRERTIIRSNQPSQNGLN